MVFDFINNTFKDPGSLSNDPFIIGTDTTLSFKEVYERHLALKALIRDLNIPAGHPVCIYGEKEAFFPVAMITLISLNIPYIPIDVIMPADRIRSIQAQSQSKVMINCTDARSTVAFEIEIFKGSEVYAAGADPVFHTLLSQDDPLRYILFTSGSTGQPKGVQITAGSLNSFVQWYTQWPVLQEQCVFMNQAPFSFDVSLCDFIGGFALSAPIILNNYAILKNGTAFMDRLRLHQANTVVCTPSFMKMYLSVPEFNAAHYPELRRFIFMGEELTAFIVKKLSAAFPAADIVNAYGPTEATVVTTYIEITPDIATAYARSLPIGYPKGDGQIVILKEDESQALGEIVIVGDHVSVGYLNDAEKTQKAFYTYEGQRAYKTGDLGYRQDGLVFFSGRKDNQVKLNGYRIEPDEITEVLLKHPQVKDAVVIPLQNGGQVKKLLAFIITGAGFDHINEQLKAYLEPILPAYMIPAEFVACAEFPFNSNYKIDKKALLESYMNG